MKVNAKIEQLYKEIRDVILSRQHPVTGLLPASTAVNSHGNYTDAWVRDNVYSIMAPWALSLAFRRQGDSVRCDELEQSTIKLMRGLLQSMMRQSKKVEVFKHTLNPLDSLHAKYSTSSGLAVVADDEWGHVQIDATSVYLLMLAQMSASGLRIIRTYDEVDFVQNLIYYIAGAYRTADYGIWERGNKINNGKTEINASSVGMAKAALQALDGLNLFGPNASPRAVVHTVADSISLARSSLASLLPRESLSKEVDSALLSIIGFPAFAVGDKKLVNKTRDAILKKLGGNYGLKRFLWDGHQTELEDASRLYYEHSELANFEHVESEWPLFYCYLYVTALFSGNEATAKHYRDKIESVMVEDNGVQLIPELYYLEKADIEAEKKNPKSQARSPNENIPLVWAQSLYYTGVLIDEGFIEADELDPVALRRRTTRFNHAQVALVIVAENADVKKQLAKNGVIAESISDIAPLHVIAAPNLVEAYAQVGANPALELTGRPRRRLQSLASSQTYNINGQKSLCLSWIQSEADDYRMHDANLVSIMLKKEIAHIRQHWLNPEVAVFTFMISEKLCNSPNAENLYRCLQSYQLRTEDENIGYASANLAYRASRENKLFVPSIRITPLRTTEEPAQVEVVLTSERSKNLLASFSANERENYERLSLFSKQYSFDITEPENVDLFELYDHLYHSSYVNNRWLIARMSFVLVGKQHNDLADYMSVLSARHFSVLVDGSDRNEFSLHSELTNQQIVDTLKEASENPIELCLLQEILENIGVLQRTNPAVFDGLRSIQLHNLLRLCATRESRPVKREMLLNVGSLSPEALFKKIEDILASHRTVYTSAENSRFSLSDRLLTSSSKDSSAVVDMNWFEWRAERGMIMSLERDFLEKVWQCLNQVPQLLLGDSNNPLCTINSEFVTSSMTPGEEIFGRLIDDALAQLHPTYFKSAIVEVLLALTEFCDKFPKVTFKAPINLSTILEQSAKDFCLDERQAAPSIRNIDIFLEEAPDKLAYYFERALLQIASREKAEAHTQLKT